MTNYMDFANVGVYIGSEKEDMLRLAYKSFRNLSTGEPVPVNEIQNLLEQDIPIEVTPYSDIVFDNDNDNYYTKIENTEELEDLLMDGFIFRDSDIFAMSTDESDMFFISNINQADHRKPKIDFSLEKANKLVKFAQQLKEQERINTHDEIKLSLALWKLSWS